MTYGLGKDNKRSWAWLVLATFLFTVAGCASLSQIIKEPQVEFKGVSMKDMSLVDGTLVFNLAVTNPNPVGIPASELTYDLTLDGKPFVNGKLDKGIQLPAQATEMVALPVHIDYSSFFGSIADVLKKDELEYTLKGKLEKYGMAVPFSAAGKVPVPQLPKISISRVMVKEVSLRGAIVDVALSMDNKNDFPVALSGLDYVVKLGGRTLVESRADAISPITEKGATTLSIPVRLDFLEMGQALFNLIREPRSTYEISGNMNVQVPGKGEKSFQYSTSGEVPIQNTH